MSDISIIIPVFNKLNFTLSALKDLFQLTTDCEIIVIDNASTDDTDKELSKITNSNFIYKRNIENLFHSKACNMGFGLASGKYVIFLNNDIRIKSNHNNWTDLIKKDCDLGIVSPTIGQLDRDFNFIKEANAQLTGNTYLSGWLLASSKENWKKLDIDGNNQIFDEQFPFYFNDTDLGFRCRKINMPMNIVDLPIVHFGKISASQLNIHKLYADARKIFIKKWKK